MLISIASAKGSPGASTSAHVLAAVWPRPAVLAELDPAGSDLVYRARILVEDDRDGQLKNGMPVTVLMESIEASEGTAPR
mgnify:CR=1 FL=1